MTLRAKLTLGSVVLASLMVGLVAVVDFQNVVQQQFETTLERANSLQAVATTYVRLSLDRQRTLPVPEALRDRALADFLLNITGTSGAILEIAVLDPHSFMILADSDQNRIGAKSPPYPDFTPVVTSYNWYQKLQALLQRHTQYYQVPESKLGPSSQDLVALVRVVIEPALIRKDIGPDIQKTAVVAVLSIIGAVLVTFLFSAVAFRPLGRIGRMLDLAAKGEFEVEEPVSVKTPSDELSVMASKVSLLGQRLRGAQSEVSDLRGNVDRLLQDLEDAVFIFDRDRNLVLASGTVEKFMATSRSSLAGKTLAAVFPPYTTLGLVISQSLESGLTVRNRRVPLPPRPQTVSGPGVVLLSVDRIQGGQNGSDTGGLLVRLRDPEAQRQIGRQLQTADRLTALSRISGGVAHEVKNPLNAILLHVEVARSMLARGQTDVAPQMEIVSREILRLDRVVKTFLDFTRPVELHFSEVPLQELVAEIVDLARPQAEYSKIEVSVKQDEDGGTVRVDRDLLKQAVLNVVVNAIEVMPGGGELRFESRLNSDTAEIRISDTGPGIAPDLRDKIFRLYFTTKTGGSGIGLAMTFRIIQLHDGTIDFTSEPGEGTTFFIRLPIAVMGEPA